ncbi:MAG TPA: type II secretion system protein GspC [Anaeromyxobacteraceae bacterium]|nr:type II secretion system protein GspC [Anaeromyxobacteraceae bacterium]
MLELFFRKYAWTANLAVLLVAAWLAAKTLNVLVGAAIRPRPQADLSAPAPVAARPALPATLDPDKLYRLIGVAPPAVDPEAEAVAQRGPQNCSDAAARPVKTSLRLQLVAGVMAERPQWSLATLADLGTRENRILGVGDEFQGARLLAVERVREERDATGNAFKVVAVICNAGTKEYVDFEPGTGPSPEAPQSLGVSAVPRPAAPGGPAEGVTKVGDNAYQVARSTIDQALTNMNSLATQARIVPSFKNGVANGFKLFSIQPGSLYASIGIENGDVIQRINGYEINSPDKALEMYQRLRESSHVTIELERAGQVVRKEYNVTGQ